MEQNKNAAPAQGVHIKMDYSLETPQERIAKTEEILTNTPSDKINNLYLEKMATYILDADKDLIKEKKILTNNNMKVVNERETSFEGLAGKLENGEDGIYSLIANDKNIIFRHKAPITEEDKEDIPELRELVDSIQNVKKNLGTATGINRFALKNQIIQMQKDQYEIKNAYKQPIRFANRGRSSIIDIGKSASKINLDEEIKFDKSGKVISSGIVNLYDHKNVSLLLCNYSSLKENCWDKFNSDMKWMMEDLDDLIEQALKEDFPLYYDLVIYKIDGKTNAEIRQLLFEKHGILHTAEYISSLWRNKIPKLIAAAASRQWVDWYYLTKKKGTYKRCAKCGQIKLANNWYFSKNSASKDKCYSICKVCRNKQKK